MYCISDNNAKEEASDTFALFLNHHCDTKAFSFLFHSITNTFFKYQRSLKKRRRLEVSIIHDGYRVFLPEEKEKNEEGEKRSEAIGNCTLSVEISSRLFRGI